MAAVPRWQPRRNARPGGAFTPEFTSIQHATIGTALNSTGSIVAGTTTNPQGFFNGLLDEVRIWNYARTQSEIQATMNQEVFVGPIGRWGLNEASGTTVASSARAIPGTAVGTPTVDSRLFLPA